MDSSAPNSRAGYPPSPTAHSSPTSAAAMTSRPSVYASIQGRTFGGVAGPPVGPTAGSVLSAMTALPFRWLRTRRSCGPASESSMASLPLGGKDDRGAGARDTPDPVQRADGGLQCRDVGHAHLEHVALAPGHPPARLGLGQGAQLLLDPGVVDRVALDDAHQCGDVQAQGGRVDDGPVAGDHPGGLQLADP